MTIPVMTELLPTVGPDPSLNKRNGDHSANQAFVKPSFSGCFNPEGPSFANADENVRCLPL
jgi:hypothetical protein